MRRYLPSPIRRLTAARVYLAGRDPAGLAGLARRVSTPGSPDCRRYLTPAQVARRFGPTGAQLRAVTGWLLGAGLTVTAITPHYVAVRGAGIQADAQALQGGPIGFANPALCARHGTLDYRDITDQPAAGVEAVQSSRNPGTGAVSYAAIAFGHDTSLHATPGYDDVTGVGTPTRRYLGSYAAHR